jgi:hypothetical protein
VLVEREELKIADCGSCCVRGGGQQRDEVDSSLPSSFFFFLPFCLPFLLPLLPGNVTDLDSDAREAHVRSKTMPSSNYAFRSLRGEIFFIA